MCYKQNAMPPYFRKRSSIYGHYSCTNNLDCSHVDSIYTSIYNSRGVCWYRMECADGSARVGLLVVQKSIYSGVERWTKSRGRDDPAITLMIRFSKNQTDNFDPTKQGITSLGRGRFLFFQKIDFLKFSCCLPRNELYTSVIQFEDEIILLGPWMPKVVSEIFNYHFNIASKIMG